MVEGLERRPLGAGLEDPPLHGRRRVGHRPAHGDHGLDARAPAPDAATTGRRSPSRATRALVAERGRRHGAQPLRAVPRACGPPPACRGRSLAQLGDMGQRPPLAGGHRAADAASTLNGPIGPHRRWDWAATTVDDIKPVRKGVRRHGQRRRARRDHRADSASCSRRVASRSTASCARSCPCRCARPRRASATATRTRCRRCSPSCRSASPTRSSGSHAVRAQMDGLKESKQAVAGEALTSLVGLRPAGAARPRRRGSPPARRSATSTP